MTTTRATRRTRGWRAGRRASAAARVARLAMVGWLAAGLTACAVHRHGTVDLAEQLDCVRERGLALVAAHRGQPDAGAAENVFSSFEASLAAGIPFLEVDVATTRDGVLVLMHDDTLDRTTTGTGPVTAATWAELQTLHVRRGDGVVLDDRIPRFDEVLAWGWRRGAYFEVDVKRTTRFDQVLQAIRRAGMTDRTLVVTYNLDDARLVHRLDPRQMISVTMETADQMAAAMVAINPHRLLAWTGTRDPGTKPFSLLRARGIEPIFGTLGRPGHRLDDEYAADGDLSEYRDLVRDGVVMIATDAAAAVQRVIGAGYRACVR